MRLQWLLAIMAASAAPSLAMWPSSWIIGQSCYTASKLGFDNCDAEDEACFCNSRNALATVALCIQKHANESSSQRDAAWDHFVLQQCKKSDPVESDRLWQSMMDYLEGTKPVSMRKLFGHRLNESDLLQQLQNTKNILQPVKIPERVFQVSNRAEVRYLYHKDISVWEGSFLVCFWLLVVLMAFISQFLRYMTVRFSHHRASMRRPPAWRRWFSRKIAMPACFGFKHMCRVRFLGANFMVPTRAEVIVIAIYFILNLIFMLAPYKFLTNDPLFPTHYKQMLRYVSDRSGIIATIQIPLFTLFAMRNNLLIWVTGWNYTIFNTYHRAIARVAYLQLIVHAITKHVFAASYGASLVQYFYPAPYYRWGVAAMFLMALMIMSGSYRTNYYEWFLRFHIVAAIIAYVCSIIHLNGLGYKQPLYVAFLVWLIDWLVRLGRVIFLNFALFIPPAHGSGRASFAQVTLLGEDVVNVKIRTPVRWKFKPGQYCFLHVNRLRLWEGHPFSIIEASVTGESFQMVCKQRGGMTKRLVQHLQQRECSPEKPVTMSVLVEGPYGTHCPIERYDNIMLVAGGVGITGVLPYVEHVVKQTPRPNVLFVWTVQKDTETQWIGDKLAKLVNENLCKIEIYAMKNVAAEMPEEGGVLQEEKDHDGVVDDGAGTVLEKQEIVNVIDRRLSNVSVDSSLTVDANVVREQHLANPHFKNMGLQSDLTLAQQDTSTPDLHQRQPYSQSANDHTPPPPPPEPPQEFPPIDWSRKIKPGRPPLNPMIGEFLRQAEGAACVLGCGPPPMMDSMRQAVVQHYEQALHGRVDYFEEAYSW